MFFSIRTWFFLLSFFYIEGLFAQPYLSAIESDQDFKKLEGTPLSGKYGGISSVKIVYDTRRKKVYYINSHDYRLHFNFCQEVLRDESDLYAFNQVNYSGSEDRVYLLANLNRIADKGGYALELAAVDLMSSKQLLTLFQSIQHTFFASSEVKLLLCSLHLQSQKSFLGQTMSLLEPSELYGSITYQAISKQKGHGRLRIIDTLNNEGRGYSIQDILVLPEAPLTLPPVAGVIVATFQTPLSHLSVLGQNRRIPVCADKLVFSDERVRKLNGRMVTFDVNETGYRLMEAVAVTKKSRPSKKIVLPSDLSVDSLMNVEQMGKRASQYAGNKAANFSLLHKLSKSASFKTPESAFVIPFYFSDQHLRKCGAYLRLDSLLSMPTGFFNDSVIRKKLSQVRKSILTHPLDSLLLQSVTGRIRSLGSYRRMRFRSSTNAEDADGFSGAGVYTSKTGEVDNDSLAIDRAIKGVWASMWTYDAYMERSYFGIDHRKVYMGVLVHRSFPDEKANGVVISKNLYRKEYYGFVVNAQFGDESVVKPKPGQVVDQFICYPPIDGEINPGQNKVDIITLSNLDQNRLVLSDKEIQQLAKETERVKYFLYRRKSQSKSYFDYGLDIEFKIVGVDRKLYLKQVRPFND
ncbi:MAG: PEP/pyruvate-binding domain-containing protein [Bacteroidota bacterium]